MSEKSPSELAKAAGILGEKGGKVGGPARARKLTKREIVAIARKGGIARQRKKPRKSK